MEAEHENVARGQVPVHHPPAGNEFAAFENLVQNCDLHLGADTRAGVVAPEDVVE
jgi:hypothetical protein